MLRAFVAIGHCAFKQANKPNILFQCAKAYLIHALYGRVMIMAHFEHQSRDSPYETSCQWNVNLYPVYEMSIYILSMKCQSISWLWNVNLYPVYEMSIYILSMKCQSISCLWNVNLYPVFEMSIYTLSMKCQSISCLWNVNLYPVYEMPIYILSMNCQSISCLWNVNLYPVICYVNIFYEMSKHQIWII